MSNLFSVGHVAQLHEIQSARLKRGLPGIAPEVEELIRRLTSGGVGTKSDDPRVQQAKCLWDKGWGRELKFDSFDEYLATIPGIGEEFITDERFPHLILVDRRPGLTKSCSLAGLRFNSNNNTFADFDPKQFKKEDVYWVTCNDGRQNRNRKTVDCRKSFAKDEIGLVAFEGVALYAQRPEVINDHFVYLCGSVHVGSRDHVAIIGCWGGVPELSWNLDVDADPDYVVASRREC